MTDKAHNLRRCAELRFRRKQKDFMGYVDGDKLMSAKKFKFDELTEAWKNLEDHHDEYVSYLDDCDIRTGEDLITTAQCMYDEAVEKYLSVCPVESNRSTNGTNCDTGMIQLEKTKLPMFSGDTRDYARFKTDFQKYVQPLVPGSVISYTLRTCLHKTAAHRVRNTDDINEMWTILDGKYANAAAVADIILDDINRTKNIQDGESQPFIEFVERVEDGYRDLSMLGLQKEISNTTFVSTIEQKLPLSVQKSWATIVSNDESTVNLSDKFPSLLKYMQHEKRALEYRRGPLRTRSIRERSMNSRTESQVTAAVQHIDLSRVQRIEERSVSKDVPRSKTCRMTCVLHNDHNHDTCDCELYKNKSVQQRYQALKMKGVCWLCLQVGHRRHECRSKKTCGVRGCKRRHHNSLHISSRDRENRIRITNEHTETCNGTQDKRKLCMKVDATQDCHEDVEPGYIANSVIPKCRSDVLLHDSTLSEQKAAQDRQIHTIAQQIQKLESDNRELQRTIEGIVRGTGVHAVTHGTGRPTSEWSGQMMTPGNDVNHRHTNVPIQHCYGFANCL